MIISWIEQVSHSIVSLVRPQHASIQFNSHFVILTLIYAFCTVKLSVPCSELTKVPLNSSCTWWFSRSWKGSLVSWRLRTDVWSNEIHVYSLEPPSINRQRLTEFLGVHPLNSKSWKALCALHVDSSSKVWCLLLILNLFMRSTVFDIVFCWQLKRSRGH